MYKSFNKLINISSILLVFLHKYITRFVQKKGDQLTDLQSFSLLRRESGAYTQTTGADTNINPASKCLIFDLDLATGCALCVPNLWTLGTGMRRGKVSGDAEDRDIPSYI